MGGLRSAVRLPLDNCAAWLATLRSAQLPIVLAFQYGECLAFALAVMQTGNPKQGGDLKDAPNKFAAEYSVRPTPATLVAVL